MGHFSKAMRDDSASIDELYSSPSGYLHAIATQSFTFFATSSGYASTSRRRLLVKPTVQTVTEPSGCAERT